MTPAEQPARKRALLIAAAAMVVILAVSLIRPHDRLTWLMETLPVMLALPLLVFTYKRFPLTTLLYVLIWLHAVVLIVGAVYTYARVPVGALVQGWFELDRNPYDKLGHLMQGFVPALIAREIFIRGRHVAGPKMRFFLVLCVVMLVSSFYELIEWGSAVAMGQNADEFLGTQGDEWDAQSDMLMAFLGALAALLTLSKLQDRQIRALDPLPVEPMHRGSVGTNGGVNDAASAQPSMH